MIIKQATNIMISQMTLFPTSALENVGSQYFGRTRRSRDAGSKALASVDNNSGICGVACRLFGRPRRLLENSGKNWSLVNNLTEPWWRLKSSNIGWRVPELVGGNFSAGA